MLKTLRYRDLTADQRMALLSRESAEDHSAAEIVSEILHNVEKGGEAAVFEYAERLDKVKLTSLFAGANELSGAAAQLDNDVRLAFERATANITEFHQLQRKSLPDANTTIGGTRIGFKYMPVTAAGIYVPGGRATYPSSTLMGLVPALVAGVKERLLITPSRPDGSIHPAVLFCANLGGATKLLKVGGAHGLAAAAFGLAGVRPDLLVGPGNRYVTEAKRQLAARGLIRMDLPAGPSEVIVIADASANAAFIAADLLSQAEHGPDSPAILLTDSLELSRQVGEEIQRGLSERPDRRELKTESIVNYSYCLLFDQLEDAFHFSNEYAPEHLEICTKDPESDFKRIEAAGSVFLGHYAPVALGDYYSGTNHVLPTGGAGRFYSGLGVDTFLKRITYQFPTKDSLREAMPHIVSMSRVEGLEHEHGHSVTVRFEE